MNSASFVAVRVAPSPMAVPFDVVSNKETSEHFDLALKETKKYIYLLLLTYFGKRQYENIYMCNSLWVATKILCGVSMRREGARHLCKLILG